MPPLRKIAVGFDGSVDARAAAYWALALAQQVDCEVVVVHAVGLLEHGARQPQADELGQAVRRLIADAAIDAARVTWQLADGDPCSVLIRAAAPPIGADLLVVGSRGQGAHAGHLLGSTSHELAEHARVPLVIVPTPEDTSARTDLT